MSEINKTNFVRYSKAIDANRTYSYSNLRSVNTTIAEFEPCQSGYWQDEAPIWLDKKRQFCISLRNGTNNINKGC